MGCGCGKKFSGGANNGAGQRVVNNLPSQQPSQATTVVRSAPVPSSLRNNPTIRRSRV